MNSKIYSTFVAIAMVSSAVPAFAQGKVSISQDGRPERIFRPISGINALDSSFMKHAAIVNMFEIQTAAIAQQKSSDPFVQQYAKEMAQEHGFAQDELTGIASSKGVSLPQGLPANMQKMVAHLSNLSGSKFDSAYQAIQKMGHEQTSNKFKGEIFAGRDQDVKSFTVKTLPAVELHYRMLLAKKTMMGPTKMDHGI